jgi:hypothetical protein
MSWMAFQPTKLTDTGVYFVASRTDPVAMPCISSLALRVGLISAVTVHTLLWHRAAQSILER